MSIRMLGPNDVLKVGDKIIYTEGDYPTIVDRLVGTKVGDLPTYKWGQIKRIERIVDDVIANVEVLKIPVIFCKSCGRGVSIIDWPPNDDNEPAMVIKHDMYACPACGSIQ